MKKITILVAVLAFFYIIGTYAPYESANTPQKIEKPEIDKKANKQACIDMFDTHVYFLQKTSMWWDKEITMNDLAIQSFAYIQRLKDARDLSSYDLKPYFRDMIKDASALSDFINKTDTLDTPEWFDTVLKNDSRSYKATVDYCQRYVK
jgi:hypothetical protein